MDTNNVPKIPNVYICDFCNINTGNKKDYNKHLLTAKHLKLEKGYIKIHKISLYICKECGLEYKHRSGLWRHNQKCKENNSVNETNNVTNSSELKTLTNIVLEIVKSNQELQKQMIEINKNNNANINTTNNSNNISISSNIMTNSNNKTFNLQVFLNEQCKDAMNLSDFMASIQLNLTDLENMEKLGYTECMFKNIFGHMDFIDIFSRPLHCSDLKRGIIYIKENGIWEKEDAQHSKLINAIRTVEKKNFQLLNEWSKKYPTFKDYDSPYNEKYLKIYGETMSGDKDNLNKVIRKLTKSCVIDKSKFNT